jgi:hypothetical protein
MELYGIYYFVLIYKCSTYTIYGLCLPPVVCRMAHVLFTLLFFCVEWCPTHIVLCFCFVCLRLVWILSVSLYCPFLIAPSVFSNVYLQFLCIVHFWLPLRYSLTFISSSTFNILCKKETQHGKISHLFHTLLTKI